MYQKQIIIGRLTADPELKQTNTGVSVVQFSVAVDRPYNSKKPDERGADFFTVVAWRATAEFVAKHFGKGRTILVEGKMQSREYTDKDGVNRRVWELVADGVNFVGDKQSSNSTSSATPAQAAAPKNNAPAAAPSVDDFEEIDGDDGDLPF